MIVLGLCLCARRSRALWWSVVLLGAIFTIRSAYICFFIGHLLGTFDRAERPAPVRQLLPISFIMFGVFLCVLAEVWQPQWLRNLCTDPTYFLFPGQFAPMQQKTFGAILVLVGIIDLEAARAFSIETLADRPLQIVVPGLSGALADPVRTCGPLYFCG